MVGATYLKSGHKYISFNGFRRFKESINNVCQRINARLLAKPNINESIKRSFVSNTDLEVLGKNDAFIRYQDHKTMMGILGRPWDAYLIIPSAIKYKESIDWTRGRFSGRVVSIVVSGGVIVEKLFLTSQGSLIVVRRSELGFFASLSSS